MDGWISSVQFAGLAEMSQRRARKLCAEVESGERIYWQGATLQVRTVQNRGGAAGRQYLVKVSSLPQYLQDRLKARQTPVERRSNASSSDAARERNWWLHVLGPALEHPKGSAERKATYEAIAARGHIDWHGERIWLSVRTLQRHALQYDEGGIAPLARAGRSDKGQKRVILYRKWDKAVPFPDEVKREIAASLEQRIGGYIASGFKGKHLRFFAAEFLRKTTDAYGQECGGFVLDAKTLGRAGKELKHLCDAQSVYKIVHLKKTDAKAMYDQAPTVPRTTAGLRPMQIVVADVHHCNVHVERENGRPGTAKMISFLDLATRRVWADFVFFERRGGVRNIDVIETFKAMVADPAWGLAETYYFDNGKEFNFADDLIDAMQLAFPLKGGGERKPIWRGQPHNPKTKPVESWFGHWEQQFLSSCQGYIGDDRMNPKRPALGKLPAPFPGGFDAFRDRAFKLLTSYEHFPQGGDLGDDTPAEAFGAWVGKGWRAAVVDPDNIDTVFTTPEVRKLKAGLFDFDGRHGGWSWPGSEQCFEKKIVVRKPKFGYGFNELAVYSMDGRRLGIAVPNEVFAFNDPRGAQHSAHLKRSRNKAIADLAKTVPEVDRAAMLVAHGEAHLPVKPNAPRAVVSVNDGEQSARVIVPRGKPVNDEAARIAENKMIQELREQVHGRKRAS
jgi:hypothetical protein